jgi:hypothetical protein
MLHGARFGECSIHESHGDLPTMTHVHASRVAPRLDARRIRRITLGATVGLLALAVAAGPAHAAAVKAKIQNDTLTVTGTVAGDVIVLRLAAGDAATLEVDVNGDGSADFRFARSRFDEIEVEAGGGNDTLRIDPTFGTFTVRADHPQRRGRQRQPDRRK